MQEFNVNSGSVNIQWDCETAAEDGVTSFAVWQFSGPEMTVTQKIKGNGADGGTARSLTITVTSGIKYVGVAPVANGVAGDFVGVKLIVDGGTTPPPPNPTGKPRPVTNVRVG